MSLPSFVSIHIFRQVFASLAACLQSLSSGMAAGFSAVLLPQLKKDITIEYDAQFDSWVAAIFPLTMSLGCIISGPFIDRLGRRLSLLINAVPFFLGWLIISYSNNITLVLVGRAITGICSGAFKPISTIYISEVTDPKYRAMSLVASMLWSNSGVIVAHSFGEHLYWRTAAIILGVPNLISALMLLYLKESPLWLISNGKSDKGKAIFNWFRGNGEAANKELNEVVKKQTDKVHKHNDMRNIVNTIFSKSFMGAFAITFVIFIETQFSGTNTFTFYGPDMIKCTFSDDVDDCVVMLIIDALRVVGTGIVFCIIKYVPRRFIFLLCSALTTVFTLCLAAFLYFVPHLLWFGLLSLVLYVIFAITLLSIGWSFVGELYPSSLRGVGSASSSTVSYLILFLVIKITPWTIDTLTMLGYYIFTACILAVCSVILYFVLPETNGKTLQEIEDYLYTDKNEFTMEITKL